MVLLRCHGIIAEGFWGFYGVTRVFWGVAEGVWGFYGVTSVFWVVAERV